MRKKNSPAVTIILILILTAGTALILYPTFSDYWNSKRQSRAIASYVEAVSNTTAEDLDKIWEEAVSYNENLKKRGSWSIYLYDDDEKSYYESQLDIDGTGMMGYVVIPKINANIAVYHGTSDSVLAKNVGHLEGTFLPVGGEGTHSVLSGHRGLTSARLFTDLDLLTNGDIFELHVLNRVLYYEIDQILIVLPEELSALSPIKGEDLCTLVTCTPYGVNSHRLLVRGHRVDPEEEIIVTGDALELTSPWAAFMIAIPMLIIILIIFLFKTKRARLKG